MAEVLTIGEPMVLLAAKEADKALKDVEQFQRYVCGAELNFSVGLTRLGHSVAYISRIGIDPFGECIKEFLENNGIGTQYLMQDDEYLTGFMLKQLVTSGDPKVAYFRKNASFSHYDVTALDKIDWSEVKHLHVTGISVALSQECRDAINKLMDTAKEKGVRISFDPNLRPSLWKSKEIMVETINGFAAKADIILPGINEGEILMGSREPEKIADFYIGLGAKAVVVKIGAKGSFVKTACGKKFNSPGFKVEKVVDTVGAGDGFAVGTISALLEGQDLEGAARRGAAIGALAVMSPGDNEGLPTREKLEAFMNA